jgi:hypothetical protein
MYVQFLSTAMLHFLFAPWANDPVHIYGNLSLTSYTMNLLLFISDEIILIDCDVIKIWMHTGG